MHININTYPSKIQFPKFDVRAFANIISVKEKVCITKLINLAGDVQHMYTKNRSIKCEQTAGKIPKARRRVNERSIYQ